MCNITKLSEKNNFDVSFLSFLAQRRFISILLCVQCNNNNHTHTHTLLTSHGVQKYILLHKQQAYMHTYLSFFMYVTPTSIIIGVREIGNWIQKVSFFQLKLLENKKETLLQRYNMNKMYISMYACYTKSLRELGKHIWYLLGFLSS